jgi:hypothetical protein
MPAQTETSLQTRAAMLHLHHARLSQVEASTLTADLLLHFLRMRDRFLFNGALNPGL